MPGCLKRESLLRQYRGTRFKKVWDALRARQTRRDEYPLVGWVSDGHREDNYALLDDLESRARGVVLLLGAWPDIDVASATGIPIDEIVRARRVIGAEAMTAERHAEIERLVGPICERLRREGKNEEWLAVRRWMALLAKPGRKKDRESPGAMWWIHENLFVLDMQDTRPMATKNCYSCRWFRGKWEPTRVYQEFCMAPKGFQRVVGRHWFYQHGGVPGLAPARRHTLCPAWTDPLPRKERDLRQSFIMPITDNDEYRLLFKKLRKPFGWHPAPWPLPEKRAFQTINSPSWLPLMKLLADKLQQEEAREKASPR